MSTQIIKHSEILSSQIKIADINLIGIYFLLKGSEIVYIWQTINGLMRVLAHKDKDYDCYSFFPVLKENLNYIESVNILHHKPIYNKNIVSTTFATIGGLNMQYKKYFGNANLRVLKKVVKILEQNKKIKIINTQHQGKNVSLIDRTDFPLIFQKANELKK